MVEDDFKSRIIKLLGMLGSEYEGERAAAGAKATQLLANNNLTWPDIIHIKKQHSYVPDYTQVSHTDLYELRDRMFGENVINEWEYDFLDSVYSLKILSQKQKMVVEKIKGKAIMSHMI